MLEYREFLDLTDDEIKFIITDMFVPDDVLKITRDSKWNEIKVELATHDFNPEKEKVTILLTLRLPNPMNDGICRLIGNDDDPKIRFHLSKENALKWKQFLLAKGCDYRLKDNPYLERSSK